MINIIKFFFIIGFQILSANTFAQKNPDIHLVELSDKENSSFSIHRPWEFLSADALERRRSAGIAIDELDLPVSPKYESDIQSLGCTIKAKSKWMNFLIVVADSIQLPLIKKMPFVVNTEALGFTRKATKWREVPPYPKESFKKKDNRYGYASNQIRMLQGHIIHDLGFEGKGKLIAILDGGFVKTDALPCFDSIRTNGQLLISKDFIDSDNYAYEDTKHGTQVLSTMAANIPGLMVGTASQSDYLCIKTEQVGAENPLEPAYWIAGLEYADSIGADICNSSLGYTHFEIKSSNFEKSKLDGETYLASKAARIAAQKGMLLFTSNGNDGRNKWQKMSVPADAKDIIAVGAVNVYGEKASFSSTGNTADGRIKPELSAMGQRTTVINATKGYKIETANGTSVASPVLAGAAASLWSAFPEQSWNQIRSALINSASQNHQPDSLIGYGIPDMTKAYAQLSGIAPFHIQQAGTRLFKTPKGYRIIFQDKNNTNIFLKNSFGNIIQSYSYQSTPSIAYIDIPKEDLSHTSFYTLHIYSDHKSWQVLIPNF